MYAHPKKGRLVPTRPVLWVWGLGVWGVGFRGLGFRARGLELQAFHCISFPLLMKPQVVPTPKTLTHSLTLQALPLLEVGVQTCLDFWSP